MFNKKKPIIGFDIGGVITKDTDAGVIFSESYLDVPEMPGAIAGVKHLCERFKGQVCLISKCMEPSQFKILHWLSHRHIFETTGVNPEHVFFCEERRGKAPICQRLGVTHFVDNRLEVLGYLKTVEHRYLFKPNEDEVLQYRGHRDKVERVESWEELLTVIHTV